MVADGELILKTEMCSNVAKNGKNSVSKLAQKGSKRCHNGSKGVKTGQKVPKRANEGVREGQNGGEKGKERKKAMNGLLCHPFSFENGLLSTVGEGRRVGTGARPPPPGGADSGF